MKEFDCICKEFEQMGALSYGATLAAKSVKVLPALHAIMGDGADGATVFATFIFGAIAADNRLSEEEYALIYPLLHAFFGDEVNYEICKAAVRMMKPASRELKKCVKEMADVFGALSDELKEDIIVICLLICAVDGKVSRKEKSWIKKLIG